MVGARGFEPPTPCAQGRCATRLRYAPTICFTNSEITSNNRTMQRRPLSARTPLMELTDSLETVLPVKVPEEDCQVERRRGERYGEKFRRRAVEQMNACDNIVRQSRKLGVQRRLLDKWRDDLEALYSPTENGETHESRELTTLASKLLDRRAAAEEDRCLELRRQGMIANHKTVIRRTREHNLLATRYRKPYRSVSDGCPRTSSLAIVHR